jgi:hypothetical protein
MSCLPIGARSGAKLNVAGKSASPIAEILDVLSRQHLRLIKKNGAKTGPWWVLTATCPALTIRCLRYIDMAAFRDLGFGPRGSIAMGHRHD